MVCNPLCLNPLGTIAISAHYPKMHAHWTALAMNSDTSLRGGWAVFVFFKTGWHISQWYICSNWMAFPRKQSNDSVPEH